MALAEIDVGPIPAGIRAVVVDYRFKGDSAYVRLGETGDRVSRWTVPAEPDILLRARFRDTRGRIGAGLEEPFRATMQVSDRPAMADLDIPAAVVKQTDGPALEVVQAVPDGSEPSEFLVEVAQTLTADTDVDNGVHGGYAAPDEPVALHAWPSDQKVWTRLVRLSDGRASPWAATSVTTQEALVSPTQTHSNDFAGGTIGTVGGVVTAEISGGDLRHKAIYAGDLTTEFAGDLSLDAGAMGLRWPIKYTTAQTTMSPAQPLMFQVEPDLTSTTRPTLYAGSWLWPAGGPPRFDPLGVPFDNRPIRDGLTAGGGDEMPMQMTTSVTVNGSTVPLVPGKVYPEVSTFSVVFEIRTYFDRLLTIDNLNVWWWTWCRARPWHTHSDAGDLIYENTIAADAASVTASFVANNWDELRVEVDWKNADASPSQFRVRFNADSGNNYYKDGAAAASSMLCGGGTLGSGWYERIMFRLARVKSGLERMVLLESGGRWSTTDSEAPDTPASVMWDNTADAITSIVFSATVGATPLASGSRFRVWGRRHHEA